MSWKRNMCLSVSTVLFLFRFNCTVESVLVDRLSFSQPFDSIDANGNRRISPSFEIGNDAIVQPHFIRLTPDRQSKRGHLWYTGKTSDNGVYLGPKLDLPSFSMILSFRISGQGSKGLGGDGIALWLTNHAKYVDGDNHGFSEYFTGVGIVFDTFVNPEHRGGHKDVTVVMNDGQKSMETQRGETKLGCMSNIRYEEKNAAFNAAVNASRAKIILDAGNNLQIFMDARNTGEWVPCFNGEVTLPVGWAKGATIGLTASTGTLADNHDILGLNVYNEIEEEHHAIQDDAVKKRIAKPEDVHKAVTATHEEKVQELQKQLQMLVENSEYKFTALKEQTSVSIEKLRVQENDDEKRIQELEVMVNARVNEKLDQTVEQFHSTVDDKLKTHVEKSAEKTSGWKLPFFILILVLGAAIGFGYKKYLDLKKSHLL